MLYRLALFFALLGSSVGLLAQPVHVVKIANFNCSVCRASSSMDPAIEAAARDTGGQFVFAPISWGEQSNAKDLVYYAAKNRDPAVAQFVSRSLYKGSQDFGLPMENSSQVMAWLEQDGLDKTGMPLAPLITESMAPLAQASYDKAVALAVTAHVNSVPGYILVVDGTPVALLDPTSVNSRLLDLREAVVSKIKQLSSLRK